MTLYRSSPYICSNAQVMSSHSVDTSSSVKRKRSLSVADTSSLLEKKTKLSLPTSLVEMFKEEG